MHAHAQKYLGGSKPEYVWAFNARPKGLLHPRNGLDLRSLTVYVCAERMI